MKWPGVIEKYRRYLPVGKHTPVITLLEGNTPLLFAPRLAKWIDGGVRLYLKFEGLNPTGSFKDRGMTVAISKAREEGARAVVCASTGNTAASAAAYAAAAGVPCYILIPKAAVAIGKLAQALMHGATVLQVKGNFDAALTVVRELGEVHGMTIVNSINPYRLEGQKTAAFEICDVLGSAPDFHSQPVGNAGNITAYWKGYREYRRYGRIGTLPQMLGFQAAGAAPIVRGHPIAHPRTVATAIRVGNPASWRGAVAARDESWGLIAAVSDAQILAAYRELARLEGIFVEPASAASVAGIKLLAGRGFFRKAKNPRVVCVLTGHGLKDPDSAIEQFHRLHTVEPNAASIAGLLKLKGKGKT